MSSAVDKALMAMSLEEEDDAPFIMPDLPQYCSSETNTLSLIGRLLNPEHQKMSSVIFAMPRKWQKKERDRGVALSSERFQFVFKSEHDLVEVLEKGLHTFNEWAIVLERWSPIPPPDFLQHIPIWVQIRNIPLNFYTKQAITDLGEVVGQVMEVVFDPSKPQNRDFLRVKIKFDVSKPLRKSKVVVLPDKQVTSVFFFYERVQKRCYLCQRLTHEQDLCPLPVKKNTERAIDMKLGIKPQTPNSVSLIIKPSDPLFGILSEEQVGPHPVLRRPKISPEVLNGMREYLSVAYGKEKIIRVERIKNFVAEAEKDPVKQKTVLRLEPAPIISSDFGKGKGLVFGYDSSESSACSAYLPLPALKLVADAMVAEASIPPFLFSSGPSSTAKVSSSYGGGTSGTRTRKNRGRNRPHSSKRFSSRGVTPAAGGPFPRKLGVDQGIIIKRKFAFQEGEEDHSHKKSSIRMIPEVGSSQDQ